ncbi:MAG TPA: rhamnulokinase family protein [Terriglobia bacterium]|nr:rhamnulokinase family protein [Terriglobia bacterium]
MNHRRSVAIDLGAGSCRVSLGEWDGSRATVRLVHRFANGPVERDGHLTWDLDRLASGVEEGLRCAAAAAPEGVDSIGIDGWAVDYVRLGADGKPLGAPFCYRDPRTETAMPEVWSRIPRQRLYELTGIQFLRFNTLYQLYADQRDGLAPAARWLNIPEYMLHWLGGALVAEYTNATHTQLVDVRTRDWCDEIFAAVGLDWLAAPEIVRPGTRLGKIQAAVGSLAPYDQTELIAPACHDTGSAVAGIPDAASDWAFISSGTWSLVGTVLDEACTSEAARAENFTNEGGVGGRIRFLKNVNGMWLLEECLREWRTQGYAGQLPELIAECARRPLPRITFAVDASELLLPGRMPSRINREIEKARGEPIPEDAGHAPEMANMIFASLAARYAEVLSALSRVTGRQFRRLYIVGGGSRNAYLNRLIEERTGLEVVPGAVESSTLGNLAIQFAALENSGSGAEASPDAVARWAERLGDCRLQSND